MYHRIAPAESGHKRGYGIQTTPEQFAWQISWLARRGAKFVTVSELLASPDCAGKVAITFDDGYADNYTTAWPILKQYKATATIYLAPEMVGIDRLSPQMIHEMNAAGIEFGAHTRTHAHLPSTEEAAARQEIFDSRALVAALTGQHCMSFAYPYGKFTDRDVALVRAAGFTSAVTTKKRILPCAKFDALRLPRLSMVGQMNPFEFWLTVTRGRYRV